MSQNTYMCVLRSASGDCEKPSPSEMEQMFAKYQAWQDKFASNILDMGGKLSDVGSVVTGSGVSDGPFVELKEIIGGYMMLTAQDMPTAIEIIKASPMVEDAAVSIEIREIHKP